MSRLSKALTVGLLTAIMGLLVSLLPVGLDVEEHLGLDLLFKLRGAMKVPSDVIIVSMDKASANNFNLVAVSNVGDAGELEGRRYEALGHSLIICPKKGMLKEGSEDKEELLIADLI